MPPTDNRGSSSKFALFSRSIFSTKQREQVHSVEAKPVHDPKELELESFQNMVAGRFGDLCDVSDGELLTAPWIKKLLDASICCLEEFGLILRKNEEQLSKHPLERMVVEFFERSVKTLDICNAIRGGIEKMRSWHKHLEIVLSVLDARQRALSEAQFRRARKALTDLALDMLEEKESKSAFALSHRNRSFGRRNMGKDNHPSRAGHSRSLSWSIPNSWSAAKQLQSIANSLVPPRGHDIVATGGLAVPVFTINFVLVFVSWTLVAAIPCQDRGLNAHIIIPQNFPWSSSVLHLHDSIMEESKHHCHANGLMREIYQMESCIHHVTDLVDCAQFPLTEEKKMEVEGAVQELAIVSKVLKDALDPLDHQVRELFRKIMHGRTEGLGLISGSNNPE